MILMTRVATVKRGQSRQGRKWLCDQKGIWLQILKSKKANALQFQILQPHMRSQKRSQEILQ